MTSAPLGLEGRTAVVTGGTGAIGGAVARGLAEAGSSVVIVARSADATAGAARMIRDAGGRALGIAADVLDRPSLDRAATQALDAFGSIDVLVNCAGGNIAAATVAPGGSVFDLDAEAFRGVVDLNLMGTLLPIQAFGPRMAASASGSIINVSSMAADRPLSRVVGYGAAKAAVENLTRWLAVHLAETFEGRLRVNAIAPGFLVGDQNRRLLLDEDGTLTERGATILARTPMRRFGDAADLVGTALWLASDWSRFVTGIVVPVDGGFSATSGV